MKHQIAALALVVLTFIGCDATKQTVETIDTPTPTKTIANTTWELTQLEGKAVNQGTQNYKKIHFTLQSATNTISGYAGCNNFTGTYTLEPGGRITISQLASTKMACLDAVLNETDVLKVFELTDNYTLQNGILSLNIGRRAPLAVFKKATMENAVVEKYWKLTTLHGKEVTMADNQEREIYFTLKREDNRLTGFTGCNTISGTYTLEKGTGIRFTNIATTLRACPDVVVNETEVLQVFNTANTYILQGDLLSLHTGNSAPLATFEAVYMN